MTKQTTGIKYSLESVDSKTGALLLTLAVVCSLFVSPSHAITKCQDADGKWYYGDVAVKSCENSKVTELNSRGIITDEKVAPKTEEQLMAEEVIQRKEEQQQAEKKAQRDEKERILSLYDTEKDIDRQRDNQLRSVQNDINVHETYLKSLARKLAIFESKEADLTNKVQKEKMQKRMSNTKLEIVEYEAELAKLVEKKEAIVLRFSEERAAYLKLKNGE